MLPPSLSLPSSLLFALLCCFPPSLLPPSPSPSFPFPLSLPCRYPTSFTPSLVCYSPRFAARASFPPPRSLVRCSLVRSALFPFPLWRFLCFFSPSISPPPAAPLLSPSLSLSLIPTCVCVLILDSHRTIGIPNSVHALSNQNQTNHTHTTSQALQSRPIMFETHKQGRSIDFEFARTACRLPASFKSIIKQRSRAFLSRC